MNIEQIKAIKLLELIEENTKQLKEFAYDKDYESKKDVEELEEEMFAIYYAIEDYLNIKELLEDAYKENDKIPFHFTNRHYFKQTIDRIKTQKNTFNKLNDLYNYLINNLDKDICYVSKTSLNIADVNNYAEINVSVNYPQKKYTSTNCIHITVFDSLTRCYKSDQPIMQSLKCYDYPKPKEYYDVVNSNNRRKEFDNSKDDYEKILEFCNSALEEAREILKDVTN